MSEVRGAAPNTPEYSQLLTQEQLMEAKNIKELCRLLARAAMELDEEYGLGAWEKEAREQKLMDNIEMVLRRVIFTWL